MKALILNLWETHGTVILSIGQSLLTALCTIITGRICVKISGRILDRAVANIPTFDETLASILKLVIQYLIIAIGIIVILDAFGINTTSLIALLGATGVAVGLALKDTLSNIAAGIILVLLRTCKKGDFIEFGSYSGTVKEMNLFVTILETPDGVFISAPNSSIWGTPLKNYTRNGKRRMDISINISYGDSIDSAFDVMREIIAEERRFLHEPAPQVVLQSYGESGITITLRAWAYGNVYWTIYWDQMRILKTKLDDAGLSIPFPQRDVRIVTALPKIPPPTPAP
ncbi:MAG: mechanosensitive ion channel [Spirochaetaceae bacterium]|jgi:small conductance mechanosensitive channel|nr:mechanosensitive ion channel [Spirochaetaceae bacterium]